jgi:PAS domain S-box-containing protein
MENSGQAVLPGVSRVLEAALEQAHESVMITDRAGATVYVNRAFEDTTGFARDEILGENPRLLKSGLESESLYADLWSTLEAGETWSGCIFNKKKDGTPFVEQMTISPLRAEDAEGDVVGYLAIKRDVTRERALEFELQHAQQTGSIGQLASGIAHELSTPTLFVGDFQAFLDAAFERLDPLLADYSSLLGDLASGETADSARVAELQARCDEAELDELRKEIPKAIKGSFDGLERVSVMVRAMREFSQRPTEGSRGERRSDVNRILENTITVARNEWKYVADVVRDFAVELPPVACRPSDLREVFLNLIVNAAEAIELMREEQKRAAERAAEEGDAEFVPEKGAIGARTRLDGDFVEIRISDTGPGIPPGAGRRIFEPYFTTKEIDKGVGQGLAVVHSLVADHYGGSIDFESELGEGTTFVLRLPVAAAPSATTSS